MAITLDATSRTDLGKRSSRHLRRKFKTPAIIISQSKDALSICLDEKKVITTALKDEFYNEVVISLNGESIKVKPVDIQRHPVSERILHIDFQRI